MTRAGRAAAAFALVAFAACAARTLGPERVPLDRAHCAFCDMVISDESNAAEVVSPADDTRFYDDIGCLAHDRATRDRRLRLYVRVHGSAAWIPAQEAWFAHPAGLETPMAHGIAAYATEAAARAADRRGRVSRWADVTREAEAHP
jgi:nitrous oxide reductase accessory protein NosL